MRFAALLSLSASAATPLDLPALWDFAQPALSEQRLRAALAQAGPEDRLILHTQIARSHGLRRDFERARELLREIEPAVRAAGPSVQARFALEWGRSWASASHPSAQLTPVALAQARQAFQQALELARAAGLDALAIDAIHMFAFVDRAPAQQLAWAEAALAVCLASTQADAQRWQASIRNNLGHALQQLGRHDEALAQLQQALALREQGGQPAAIRVARWMVARSLRSLGRVDEALQIQLALEREADAAGQPDPHVFAELETLYLARGEPAQARHYAQRRAAAAPATP